VPAFAITSETNDLRIEEHILDLQVLVKRKKSPQQIDWGYPMQQVNWTPLSHATLSAIPRL